MRPRTSIHHKADRSGIQPVVDRRFHRRRYDAAKQSRRSAPACRTRSTSTRSRRNCSPSPTKPCSHRWCPYGCDGTVALSRNALGKPSNVEALLHGRTPRRGRTTRPCHDLSSLSGGVEAVGRGDRSMQQCHPGQPRDDAAAQRTAMQRPSVEVHPVPRTCPRTATRR